MMLEQSVDDVDVLRAAVAPVMGIEDTTFGGPNSFYVRFRGRLTMDSVEAYALVAERFKERGYTALFQRDGGREAVLAVKAVPVSPSRPWVNYVMLGLTLVSVLWTGGIYSYQGPELGLVETILVGFQNMAAGWPFALSLLGILLAHEMGHYLMARRHGVAATLPFFIPMPLISPFGTMGAVIRLKSQPPNRRALLDIGLAGPLAGLVVAVPVLLYGLATSPVQAIQVGEPTSFEGNSILYVALKWLVFGRLLPEPATFGNWPPLLFMLRYYLTGTPLPLGGADVILNQVAWAGWAGLLVTGLNLVPAGQLDGGHLLHVLLGPRGARRVLPFILAVMVGLGFFWPTWLLYAALIYFFVGRSYAEVLDQVTELDGKRKVLAVVGLVVFVLVITPIPLVVSL